MYDGSLYAEKVTKNAAKISSPLDILKGWLISGTYDDIEFSIE